MPECAIIIINWNSWDYLFPCLDAVIRQSCQGFRIIVVDNASSDQTPAAHLKQYSRLTFIQNAENTGFAAANNQAIQLAEDCEWVVLLNPDTIPEEQWLEALLQAAAVYQNFSFFGSRLIQAECPDRLDGIGDVYHISGLSWRAGHGQPLSFVDDQAHEIFSPCAAAAMYRREDILSVGGFDEDFFCYMEDVDLGFRLRLAGFRALSVPDSVVLHHGSATTSCRSDFSVYHGHRNLVWAWFKDMPILLLWLFMPIHVGYNIACMLLYIIRGQGRVILQAKWDAVKGIPAAWSKRRNIHPYARVSWASMWKVLNKNIFVGPTAKYTSRL